MTSDLNANCITMETIEQKIADEYLDNLILDTINGLFLSDDLARLDELVHLD